MKVERARNFDLLDLEEIALIIKFDVIKKCDLYLKSVIFILKGYHDRKNRGFNYKKPPPTSSKSPRNLKK